MFGVNVEGKFPPMRSKTPFSTSKLDRASPHGHIHELWPLITKNITFSSTDGWINEWNHRDEDQCPTIEIEVKERWGFSRHQMKFPSDVILYPLFSIHRQYTMLVTVASWSYLLIIEMHLNFVLKCIYMLIWHHKIYYNEKTYRRQSKYKII